MKNNKEQKQYIANEYTKKDLFLSVALSLIAIFFVIGFVFWTFIPYRQMMVWKNGITRFLDGDDTAFPNSSFIYEKYNNSTQGNLRLGAFSNLFNQYVGGRRSGYTPIYDIALNREKEWVDEHPYRYDNLLSIAKGYEFKANLTGDTSYYTLADEYYQKALALCPERQDLLYAYSQHLSNTGKKQEAIVLLERMLEQNKDLPQTAYYLGLVLAANNNQDYDRAIVTLENAFDSGKVMADPIVVKAVYEHFFVYYYSKGNIKNFSTAVRRLIWVDPSQTEVYKKISDYVDTYHSIPHLDIHN